MINNIASYFVIEILLIFIDLILDEKIYFLRFYLNSKFNIVYNYCL